MALTPYISILQPSPGAPFTYVAPPAAPAMITLTGSCFPAPDGSSVQITVWIENPGGGMLTSTGSAGANPGTWTATFPVPQSGGGKNYAIIVRIKWTNPTFPGGAAADSDQIIVQLS